VTYKTGFWTGWLNLLHLIHSHSSGLQEIQRYRWSTHFPVHSCSRTRILSSLVVSWQQIYHSPTVTSNHTWSLLVTAFFFSCHYSQSPSTAISITRPNSLDCCSILLSSDCALGTDPTENAVFYCQECVFTGPLPGNECPSIVACACVTWICLPTRCLAMDIHATVY
jgi:hypothetical protein